MVQKAITPPDSSSSECHGSSSPEAKTNVKAAAPSRQPLSRRGHFKSRLGCFSCKRRRVKCNEARPECSPCRRLGLACGYPTPKLPSAVQSVVRANPSVLSLQDLRFYHQFLTAGFPTLPLKGKKVWADCAAMSYNVSSHICSPSRLHDHCLGAYSNSSSASMKAWPMPSLR